MQNLLLWLAKFQRTLNFHPCKVSTIKVRALIGKELDPLSWDGDMRENTDEAGRDPYEAGDTELLDSD